MAKMYGTRPSALMGIEEPYEAFCLDEACALIRIRIENEEIPRFKKTYKSFTDLYKAYK